MPWLLLILTGSICLCLAPEVAGALPLEAADLRLVIGGALLGLLPALLAGPLEARTSARRRRRPRAPR